MPIDRTLLKDDTLVKIGWNYGKCSLGDKSGGFMMYDLPQFIFGTGQGWDIRQLISWQKIVTCGSNVFVTISVLEINEGAPQIQFTFGPIDSYNTGVKYYIRILNFRHPKKHENNTVSVHYYNHVTNDYITLDTAHYDQFYGWIPSETLVDISDPPQGPYNARA